MGLGVLKNSNFRGELLVFRGKPLQFGVCREVQEAILGVLKVVGFEGEHWVWGVGGASCGWGQSFCCRAGSFILGFLKDGGNLGKNIGV